MNIEDFRNYCIAKKAVVEEFPFDETTLVFKVMGKIFALTDTENDFTMNLKCIPEQAIELREKYPNTVLPGYHMNKKHWNTIVGNGEASDEQIKEWIDLSYDLVVQKLTKAQKEELKNM
ncbi:MAG: MmcQ/YjbR family DNA-binding protein [Bacteroidales bacterium]|nr:MmcQ/YjbR family DNA-binding protein [Bacteroidales bacterium]